MPLRRRLRENGYHGYLPTRMSDGSDKTSTCLYRWVLYIENPKDASRDWDERLDRDPRARRRPKCTDKVRTSRTS